MKTATVRTLRNDYAKLLRRVEAGEEIAISRRGRIVARLLPAAAEKPAKVDWAQSAAFRVCKELPALTAEQSAALLQENRGNW